jgi:hypothetical protein
VSAYTVSSRYGCIACVQTFMNSDLVNPFVYADVKMQGVYACSSLFDTRYPG